jgi:hypothetical protein
LESAKAEIMSEMPGHVTHMGVHDHGFNCISTYGGLLRLVLHEKIPALPGERALYEMALRCSGAVQARRWTALPEGGFIHSFNGPHSLFVDTMRSLRSLALAHQLGHVLLEERDEEVSLLQRLIHHAHATVKYIVYFGEGRDAYDVKGRTAHEAIFSTVDGSYRCPSSQQGYSPFTTWMRGLAWMMCGGAEQLEFLRGLPKQSLENCMGGRTVMAELQKASIATSDFYLDNTPEDGMPYWDSGAPGLSRMEKFLEKPADPFNPFEPVDSSAAAIAAQGLLRLGHFLGIEESQPGHRYWQAGLTVMNSLLDEPYLSTESGHQGLILHSVYHRPNGWDHVPQNAKVPCGEATMWGDYHAREAALYIQCIIDWEPYYTFNS